MPGYWIARHKVMNQVEYRRYTDRVPAILQKYGGKILTQGAQYETVEGPPHFNRFVVIEFESMQAAQRCFDSPEYVEAAAFRRSGAAENEVTIAASGDGQDRK